MNGIIKKPFPLNSIVNLVSKSVDDILKLDAGIYYIWVNTATNVEASNAWSLVTIAQGWSGSTQKICIITSRRGISITNYDGTQWLGWKNLLLT